MKVLVVSAHPVPGSYTNHLRDRAEAVLRRRGHDVQVTDLHVEGFEARLTRAEWLGHRDDPGSRTDVAPYTAQLQWAEALVLVYPTWWSGMPAIMKGWVDRVWIDGVAYTLPPGRARVRANLRNIRRVTVISPHGSSKWVNVLEGETGKHMVGRALRVLLHPRARTRWLAIYDMDRADPVRLARFTTRVERAMARLGS